jgi:uncharacterized protein YgiM (DUF1202 family)
MRFRLALLLLTLLLGACNLSTSTELTSQAPITPGVTASGRPSVTISDPDDGAEFVVNENVLVSAGATDSVGVTRVELRANGQVVKTVSSQQASGEQNLAALLDYRPTLTGTVTLQVVAYRNTIASDPAQVQIVVRQTQTQVTATRPPDISVPVIDPNDQTCRLLPNTTVNLRSGPGTTYNPLGALVAGTVAPIVGRLPDNSWWQVRVSSTFGWVTGDRQFVTILGNCLSIPVVAPPATPTRFVTVTPPPTNTLTTTPLPPTLTPTPGSPDLVVTNVSIPPSLTLGPGGTPVTANVAVTITNVGSGPSGQFNNTVTVQATGATVSLGIVSGLNPGQSVVLTASLTFSNVGGTLILATTDSDNTVGESNNANNIGQANVTVNAAP